MGLGQKVKRALGEGIRKASTPISIIVGLGASAYCTWTYYKRPDLREFAVRESLVGLLTALATKGSLDMIAQILLVEESPTQTKSQAALRFAEKYGPMTIGSCIAHYGAGQDTVENLIDLGEHLIEQTPYTTKPLFWANLINMSALYVAKLIIGITVIDILWLGIKDNMFKAAPRLLAGGILTRLGKHEQAEAQYAHLKYTLSDTEFRDAIAVTRLRRGDQGSFLLQLREVIEARLAGNRFMSYDPMVAAITLSQLRKQEKRARKKPTLETRFTLFRHQIYYGHGASAAETLQGLSNDFPEEHGIHLLHALFLEARGGTPQKAQATKRQALEMIVEAGETQQAFQASGEQHRNEVMFYKPQASKFLAGTVVCKRNTDPQGLQQEHQNLTFLRGHPHLQDRVVRVLDFFRYQDQHYLALMYAGDKTLKDCIPRSGRANDDYFALLQECLDIMVDIQYLMEQGEGAPQLDDIAERNGHYYTERMQSVFFDQMKKYGIPIDPAIEKLVMRLEDHMGLTLAMAPRITYGYYSDPNPGNWLIDQNGQPVRGDLEGNRILPLFFELILLFDFTGPLLTQEDKDYLGEEFLEKREARFGKPIDRQMYDKIKPYAGYHKHLEQAGYKARDAAQARAQGKNPLPHLSVLHHHLEMSRGYIDGVIEQSHIARRSPALFKEVQSALGEIKISGLPAL